MGVPTGFSAIDLDRYIEFHVRANPDADRAEVRAQLKYAIDAHRKGIRCECGAPIWIVGSAFGGLGCFTCITLNSAPDNDYEIDIEPDRA
jgi:hypothetical protein